MKMVKVKKVNRYETEVTYELNGDVEDMAFIVMEKISDDRWTVATGYNNNTPYGFNSKDVDAEFKTGYEAKKEVAKRAGEWKARFESLGA
jgi:hypothetical protein